MSRIPDLEHWKMLNCLYIFNYRLTISCSIKHVCYRPFLCELLGLFSSQLRVEACTVFLERALAVLCNPQTLEEGRVLLAEEGNIAVSARDRPPLECGQQVLDAHCRRRSGSPQCIVPRGGGHGALGTGGWPPQELK